LQTGDINLKTSGSLVSDSTLAIDKKAQSQLKQMKNIDIIIGIPSYNNAKSIGRVIKAAELGLAKYFPQHKGLIFISEGGDVEETRNAVDVLSDKHYFESAFIARPKLQTEILVTKYQGLSGKGTALKAIFEAARLLRTKAGCMLDADLRSISPELLPI
jgi:glycosyltransferase involved in cell wall biosynthesis